MTRSRIRDCWGYRATGGDRDYFVVFSKFCGVYSETEHTLGILPFPSFAGVIWGGVFFTGDWVLVGGFLEGGKGDEVSKYLLILIGTIL